MSVDVQVLLKRRNDYEHLNWYSVGEGLLFLGDGLKKYAENEMRQVHASIITNIGGIKCNCKCTLGMKPNPHSGTTTCVWAQELKKLHVFKRKTDIPWHQSDSNQWHDPVVGYWEIAKLFMSDIGPDTAKITDPSCTDVGLLLALFRFCKHFKIQKPLLKAVTTKRNEWAHSPNFKLNDADKKTTFQDIKCLMNDPELLVCKNVQDCMPKIEKAEEADMVILEEAQLRLIKEVQCIKELENLQMNKSVNEKLDIVVNNVSRIDSILALLSFMLACWCIFTTFFPWCFTVFSQIFYRTLSNEACSSTIFKSPISHLGLQRFDFSPYLAYKREGFIGREWFFLELDNKFETDRGAQGLLITGEPGSGKSALMSQLICSPYSNTHIHENIIGYHLCEYSEKGKRDGAKFVSNLVDQIATRYPGYSELVVKNNQIKRELLDGLCHQDVTGCFFTSILGPLRKLKPVNGLRYIVIDALDECFDGDKTSEIIDILSSKIPLFPKWLKVILTSRNLTIVTTRIPQTVKRMALYANDDRNVKDIRSYVSTFISQNSFFLDRFSRAYTMENFLDKVIVKAEGNFLFVKTSLQYMIDSDGIFDLHSLPTSLSDLYNIFFNRQFGKDGLGKLRYLFEVLLSVCSPLQLNDLKEILRKEYEIEDISQLIEQANCFLRSGRDGTVTIYHQSFAEWLINQFAVVQVNTTRAHQNIAKFLVRRINEKQLNVTFEEIIELFLHILSGMTLEENKRALDLLNITEMRESRTSRSILHHLATKSKLFLPVLDFFIPKFKTVNILDASKKTPAFYAASEGFVDNLRRFIEKGTDASSFLPRFTKLDTILSVVRNTGIEEYSLIHVAAARGHKDVVALLMKNNVSLDEASRSYPTPLHLAAGNGHLDILRLLHDYGAKFDVNTLHHAAARNHLDIVKFLLKTVGVRDSCLQCTCLPENRLKVSVEDVHSYFCETALHAAVSRRNIDIVKTLLAFGNQTLECKHHSGKTVLMDAVERSDLEMVDLLLEHGANVRTQCGSKIEESSKREMCSLYSLYETDFLYTVYCKDDSCTCGNTAIHVSAQYGFWEMAKKLTRKNASDLTKVENKVVYVYFAIGCIRIIWLIWFGYKEIREYWTNCWELKSSRMFVNFFFTILDVTYYVFL